MHAVAPFSHFSAVSELFVTAGVFYFFAKAWRRDDFRWGFIWIVVAFETLFNITYMAARFANHEPSPDYPGWTTALLAAHGTLSLVMFLGLIAFIAVAFRNRHVERVNYFREHGTLTAAFLFLWCVSILSGEAIYLLQVFDVTQV